MKIILLEDVPHVGKKYDIKEVANGFARNFLIPRKKAKIATVGALSDIKRLHMERATQREKEKQTFAELLHKIRGEQLVLEADTNEKGVLFAAVSKETITKLIKEKTGMELETAKVELSEPLKKTGEYTIAVFEGENKIPITLTIVEKKG